MLLLRQWSSSEGALRAALRRRITTGEAVADALAAGRHPSRQELTLWTLGEDAQQLPLVGLLAPHNSDLSSSRELRERLEHHLGSLRDLLSHCRSRPSPDATRTAVLRSLLQEHRGEKVLAFTQFAETAAAYWANLRALPRVAMLTARGGTVAGGAITRATALRRFAPRSLGVPLPRESERIDCVVTTDILSEGLDLQDASVVVHLDQPWTPARLEQRVGRVIRPGAAHERVVVRVMPAPVDAETIVGIEARLRAKLDAARSSLGGGVMPLALGNVFAVSSAPSAIGSGDRTASVIASWRRPDAVVDPPVAAVVAGTACGWLAAVSHGERCTVVANIGGTVSGDPGHLARACELAEGPACQDAGAASRALEEIDRWIAGYDAARLAGVGDLSPVAPRASIARAASAVARLGRSRRAELAPRADTARLLVTAPGGIGRECELAELVSRGADGLPSVDATIPRELFGEGRLVAAVVFAGAR
jgi:hypothetical protein